jgi:phage terminase large subunit-like protein
VARPLKRSTRNINWIQEFCRIPEGKDIGKPVRLREWQRRIIRKVYDNPSGTRRAIISMARKNAKTSLSAFILLLHLCGPEYKRNSQLYSAAQARDQAALLFALAVKIIYLSPVLHSVLGIRETKKQIYCPELGTMYGALSADARTNYGLSPALAIHDELGQVKGPRSEMYDAIESAMGGQEAPLSIIISTQAPTDADLLSLLIDDALTGADPTTVLELHTAPIEDDPFAEKTIRKANPAYGDFLNPIVVQERAQAARRMPHDEASYRNLHLNQRVEAAGSFVSHSVWMGCAGPVIDDFGDLPVFAGLDLSSVHDLSAFVAIADVDGMWNVKPTFWLPEEGLTEKSHKDHVPYDVWARQGLLKTTPGRSIDYRFVAHFIWEFCGEHNVRKIGFDRYAYRYLQPALVDAGFRDDQVEGDDALFVPLAQGVQTISPALLSLEAKLLNGKIAHGGQQVLTMCARNARVKSDEKENRLLDKLRSHGRIDGMQALAMAEAVAGTFAAPTFIDIRAMVG